MKLFDKIVHLRSQAAFLYDLGKQRKMDEVKIAGTIVPLNIRLEEDIKHASVKEKAMAVKSLESQVELLINDMRFTEEKIRESSFYIDKIKLSLSEEMGDSGHVEDSGYIVTKVNDQISIR